MSKINYDNQIPIYRNTIGNTFMKLDTRNNRIEIRDASSNNIYINSKEFSNGTQVLPYVQMYENINAVNASVWPAPDATTIEVNERILLNGGLGFTNSLGSQQIKMNDPSGLESNLSADNITHLNTITGDYFSNNADTLQVNNVTNPSYIICSPFNGFTIQNDVKGGSPNQLAQLTHSQLQIIDPTTSDSNISTAYDINLTDSSNVNNLSVTPNYLRFRDIPAGQSTEIAQTQFTIDQRDYYLSTSTQNMLKCKNIGLGYNITLGFTAYTINKNDNFVLVDDGYSLVTFQDPTAYLDQQTSQAGWTCMVSNINSTDISVDFNGGYQWYSSATGMGSGTFALKKFATASFTLVYSTNLGNYYWAISMY